MARCCAFLLALLLLAPLPAAAQLIGDVVDRQTPLEAPRVERQGKVPTLHYRSGPVMAPFTGVALQGFYEGEVTGWVRFEERGAWGAWQPLYVVRSATDPAFLAGFRGEEVREGARFELRFDGARPDGLVLLGVGVFDGRMDADAVIEEEPAPAVPERALRGRDLIVPPVLHDRADWGAEPFRGDPVPLARPVYGTMTLHHAAGFGAVTLEEGLEQVKRIQEFHQNVRGWSDIGYQFVMDQSGRLYQGRPFLGAGVPFEAGPPLALGAHVGGFNTGNIGVCALGCYHPPEGAGCRDVLDEAAFDSLATVFAFLSERYGVPPADLRGHRDFSSTACPGDNNYARLPALRARIAELLLVGNRPLGTATLAATVGESGVVTLQLDFLEVLDIVGYRVERAYGAAVETVTEREGAAPAAFTDDALGRPGPVTYRLVGISAAGREQLLAVAEVDVPPPDGYALAAAFPNPTTGPTTVRYFLEREGLTTLTVYDALGRAVATFDEGYQSGGRWHAVHWTPGDLASGTYYYRLHVEGFADTDFARSGTVVVVR